jgi:hypothetical protein
MEASQPTPLSVEQCKDLLRIVAKMMCVKAELISTRLLSIDDKQDMVAGLLPVDCLITGVRTWCKAGMPDYANGKFDVYREIVEKPMKRYRCHGTR